MLISFFTNFVLTSGLISLVKTTSSSIVCVKANNSLILFLSSSSLTLSSSTSLVSFKTSFLSSNRATFASLKLFYKSAISFFLFLNSHSVLCLSYYLYLSSSNFSSHSVLSISKAFILSLYSNKFN
jgi:hypothetical protein